MTNDEKKIMNFANIRVDILLVITAFVSIGIFAWTISEERSAIYAQITRLERISLQNSESIKKIADLIEAKTSSRYTESDSHRDCLINHIINEGSFICPHIIDTLYKTEYVKRQWAAVVSKK
ncbi:MAG: hypothetical protein AAF228_12550 [Pseudomonadota bacterium]